MTQVFVSRETVNDEFVLIAKVHVRHGMPVREGDPILDIETSKTAVEMHAPADGTLALNVSEDDEVEIGGLLFEILSPHGQVEAVHIEQKTAPAKPIAPAAPPPQPVTVPQAVLTAVTGEVPTLPVISAPALEAMEALGLVPAQFSGRDHVTVADVQAMAGLESARAHAHATPQPEPLSNAAPATASVAATPELAHTLQRRTPRKRAEVANLTVYGNATAQSTVAIALTPPGSRLQPAPALFSDSITDLVVYESSRLLRQYPALNAMHVDARNYANYAQVNVGLSFDQGSDLKVLALLDADNHSLEQTQREFERLLDLYESGQTLPAEVLGSATVTVSDLSQTPASYMLPLLNGQQSLIIGITAQATAGGERGYTIYASFDHRIAEGLTVTQFLDDLRQRVLSHYRAAGVAQILCASCDKSMAEELSLGARGMLSMLLPDGSQGAICRNCHEGW